jgi:hypothetical protein
VKALAAKGVTRRRKEELFHGLDMVIDARRIWKQARPRHPEEHWHYRCESKKVGPFFAGFRFQPQALSAGGIVTCTMVGGNGR